MKGICRYCGKEITLHRLWMGAQYTYVDSDKRYKCSDNKKMHLPTSDDQK